MNDVYQKYELTKGNHLRYYFNNNVQQNWRMHPYETAHCKVGTGYQYNAKSFVESLTTTAHTLYDRHGSNFLLFLSGGLDSEIAFRIFYINEMPVTPIIVRFADDLNLGDVHDAILLCKKFGVTPVIYDIDPREFFLSGDWRQIAETYQCYSFYQQLLLGIAEKLKTPMITIDEVEISKYEQTWFFSKKEDQDACWHRFVDRTDILAYNNFYTYDPDTILAFIECSTVQNLINNRTPGKLSWTSSKHAIYTELTGFDLQRRYKRTGMEKMMNIWDYVLEHSARILFESPATFNFNAHKLSHLKLGKEITCNSV